MPASPICEARQASDPFVVVDGYTFEVVSGTLDIRLEDTTGVTTWAITCISSDETSTPLVVTRASPPAMLATVTIPAGTGKAWIFESRINGGIANGRVEPALTTRFKVMLPAAGGLAIGALNETTESGTHGWLGIVNGAARAAASGGGGGGPTIPSDAHCILLGESGTVAAAPFSAADDGKFPRVVVSGGTPSIDYVDIAEAFEPPTDPLRLFFVNASGDLVPLDFPAAAGDMLVGFRESDGQPMAVDPGDTYVNSGTLRIAAITGSSGELGIASSVERVVSAGFVGVAATTQRRPRITFGSAVADQLVYEESIPTNSSRTFSAQLTVRNSGTQCKRYDGYWTVERVTSSATLTGSFNAGVGSLAGTSATCTVYDAGGGDWRVRWRVTAGAAGSATLLLDREGT